MVDFDDEDLFTDLTLRERQQTFNRVSKMKEDRPNIQQLMQKDDDVMSKLLKRSKRFNIGVREYTFDNSEQIFYRPGPIPQKSQKACKECPTCRKAF